MSSEGKVQVIVRSKKVPAYMVAYDVPIYGPTPFGVQSFKQRRYETIYESVLDVEDSAAIQEARKLSSSLGLKLEVMDKSKGSLFARLFSALRRADARPKVTVSIPGAWSGASSRENSPVQPRNRPLNA